jgi:palmitoyltransferase
MDDPFIDKPDEDWIQAVKNRQHADLQRRKTFHKRYNDNEREDDPGVLPDDTSSDGEEAWRNAEGERLADFGVDEDIEFYDEDTIPLAELIRRRKEQTKDP